MECGLACAGGACKLLPKQIVACAWVKQLSSFPHISIPAGRVKRCLSFVEQQKANVQEQEASAQQRQRHLERQQQQCLKQQQEVLLEGQQQRTLHAQQREKHRSKQLRVDDGSSQMKRQIRLGASKLQQRQPEQWWQLPFNYKVKEVVQVFGCGVEACRRSYSSTAGTQKKKKKRSSRQREGGKQKLIEKERVIRNPFQYENKRDGIELVKRGKIFSPEEVKDGYHLAVLLVTLQKFGFAEDKALLFRYAERAYALSPLLYPKPAALILNVLARQQLFHAPLLQSLSSRLVPRLLRHANAQDLALLLHAFAAFRWPDPTFFAAAAEEIPHKLPFFEPQHLVATAQAINKLHSYSNSSTFGDVGCRRGEAIAAAAAEHHALLLDDIAEETLRKLPRFDARATALIAAALGSAAAATQRQRDLVSLTDRSTSTYVTTTTSFLSTAGQRNIPLPPPHSASAVASSCQTTTAAPAAAACAAQRAATAPVTFSAAGGDATCASAVCSDVAGATAGADFRASFFISPAGGGGRTGRCMRPVFWNRLLAHAFALCEEMDAAELVKVFSGAANAQAEQHEAFAFFVSSRVLEVFDRLPLALLSQLFNACAKWGYYDKRLFAALTQRCAAAAAATEARGTAGIAAAAAAKHETPDVSCIGQLLRACGCLRHRDPLLVNYLASRLYHHAVDAAAAAHAAASISTAVRSDAVGFVHDPAAAAAFSVGAVRSPVSPTTSSEGKVASGTVQQQQNSQTSYDENAFVRQKPQHRLTPQTLAVTLRALYRLRWGQYELQNCSSETSSRNSGHVAGSSNDKRCSRHVASSNNNTVACNSGKVPKRERDIWKKELVPLLAHLVLQQLQLFTPQGLCECADALSGLLLRDERNRHQQMPRQQQWQQQEHEQLEEQEQQINVDPCEEEEVVERRLLQCDENILFYRLAEQLTCLWSLLTLQGVLSIIRAFGRRGRNGDIPLFHRCIDRVRHAVRSMNFEECYIAKHAVVASLAHALRDTRPLTLLPWQSRENEKQQKQYQQPESQQQQDQQQDEGQRKYKQQQKYGIQGVLQLQTAEKDSCGTSAAFDENRALYGGATYPPLARLNADTINSTAPDNATACVNTSITRRTTEADTLHRIASLAAALDRRLHALSTSAVIAHTRPCSTSAPVVKSNRPAIVDGEAAGAEGSVVPAVAEEGTSVAALRASPASLLLRNRSASDAAAAAAAAAKEEELAALLFNSSACCTHSADIHLDPDNDDLGTLQEDNQNVEGLPPRNQKNSDMQKFESATEENSARTQPALKHDWKKQAKGHHGIQQQQREIEQSLQSREEPQPFRKQLQDRREDTNVIHTAAEAQSAGGSPGLNEGASAGIFGDSLDVLLEWQTGATSSEGLSRDSSRTRGTSTNRISGMRSTSSSNGRSCDNEETSSLTSRSSIDESSSRSIRRRSNSSAVGSIGKKRNITKRGRGCQQEQQPFSACRVQQVTHLLATENSRQLQATRQPQQLNETNKERPIEERNVDEELEGPRLSLRELLRDPFETMQQTALHTVEHCRDTNVIGTREHQSPAVDVSNGEGACGRTVEEKVRAEDWPQQHQYRRGDQQVRRRKWHYETWAQQHPQQNEGEDTQTHVTKGRRRRRQRVLLQQEEEEQQASMYYRETAAAADKETNAVFEEKKYSLSASLSLPFTSSDSRVTGRQVEQWHQGTTTAKSLCTTEAVVKKQDRSNEESGTLLAAEVTLPKDLYASRVDDTGLIVRNKQLRDRAAAVGGYETGYVDLTTLLGTTTTSALRRQESSSTDPLPGIPAQRLACTANDNCRHNDSPNELPSSSSSSSWNTKRRGSCVMQGCAASVASTDVPLFSAATGGRKSKRK